MNAKERFAKRTGVSLDKIGTFEIRLADLLDHGALVQVKCTGMGRFEREVTRHERGIADDDPRAGRYTKGSVKTIPVDLYDKLCVIRETARQRLNNGFTSYELTGFQPWRYIPANKFNGWLTNQQALELEWDAIIKLIVDALPGFIEQEKVFAEQTALRSWDAIWACHEKHIAVKVDGMLYRNTDEGRHEFVQRVISHVVSKIPSNGIVKGARLSWEVSIVETASSIYRRAAAEHKAEVIMFQAGAEAQRAQTAKHRADWELDKEKQLARYELSQMQEVVAQKIQEQLANLPDPDEEMMSQLRSTIGRTATTVKKSLDEKGRLYKATSTAIENMTEGFDGMNSGDEELEELILMLRAAMARTAEGYNYPAISSVLGAISSLCNENAHEFASRQSIVAGVMAID